MPAHSHPSVFVVTAHGRQPLRCEPGELLLEALQRHGVPWAAVSIYVVSRQTGELRLEAPLDRPIGEIEDAAEILLFFNRNVNPFKFSLDSFKLVETGDGGRQATEYFYQELDNERSACSTYLKKVCASECQEVIAQRVEAMVDEHLPAGAELVVGVSGGGDSNAMLHGLTRLRDSGLKIHPVILKGIPDWDLGVPRAEELCDSYGLELTVIEEPEVRDLLGMERDSTPLIDRFEREFQGDDFEFLGTLLIRLGLSKRAEEVGTSYICTGLNLEDILCEAMFRLASGLAPAPFPVRRIGDVHLLFPLWLCPKRIIDGCFPKFSLDNYQARYPCFSLGRNLYYSVIYDLQSRFPSFPEQLAHGLSELSRDNQPTYTYNDQLGFHVERSVPFPLLRKFQRMLGRSVTAG